MRAPENYIKRLHQRLLAVFLV